MYQKIQMVSLDIREKQYTYVAFIISNCEQKLKFNTD